MKTLILAMMFTASPQHMEQGNRIDFVDAHEGSNLTTEQRVAAVTSATDRVDENLRRYAEVRARHHPNEAYRLAGSQAASQGRWERAADMFRSAARYADKYSQHRLSMLHWYGVGVPEDRVLGYIWADLAAERGYPRLLAIREKMWAQLTAAQQADVAVRGPAVRAEFADEVAKDRFRTAMGRVRLSTAGSRTGFDAGARSTDASLIGNLLGRRTIASLFDTQAMNQIYERDRNDPDAYWAVEDKTWRVDVEVGEIEDVSRTRTNDAKP